MLLKMCTVKQLFNETMLEVGSRNDVQLNTCIIEKGLELEILSSVSY